MWSFLTFLSLFLSLLLLKQVTLNQNYVERRRVAIRIVQSSEKIFVDRQKSEKYTMADPWISESTSKHPSTDSNSWK